MAKKPTVRELEKRVLDAIPSNWCDSLLTGPDKVIQEGYVYNGRDIERLLNAVRERVAAAIRARRETL